MSNPREPWKYEQPLCAEIGTDLFYLDDRDEVKCIQLIRDYDNAKKICNSCSHIVECREWGIKNETHGFWGGLTPRERKLIRGRLKISVAEHIIRSV